MLSVTCSDLNLAPGRTSSPQLPTGPGVVTRTDKIPVYGEPEGKQVKRLLNAEPAFFPNQASASTPGSATGGPTGVTEAPTGAGGLGQTWAQLPPLLARSVVQAPGSSAHSHLTRLLPLS